MNAKVSWLQLSLALMALCSSPLATHASASTAAPTKAIIGTSQTDDEKTLYALGVLISHNLDNFQLSPAEFDLVKAGLTDGYNHRANDIDLASAGPKTQKLQRERYAVLVKKLRDDGEAYLNNAAAAPGARKTTSGLVFIPVREGSGASPGRNDQVNVDYEGKLVDGTVFDSSIKRGQPATFSLTGVIPCWTEALQLMKVGGESRIVCPSGLAYGERGSPPSIRPGSTLEFRVKLLGFTTAPPAATAANPVDASAAGAVH